MPLSFWPPCGASSSQRRSGRWTCPEEHCGTKLLRRACLTGSSGSAGPVCQNSSSAWALSPGFVPSSLGGGRVRAPPDAAQASGRVGDQTSLPSSTRKEAVAARGALCVGRCWQAGPPRLKVCDLKLPASSRGAASWWQWRGLPVLQAHALTLWLNEALSSRAWLRRLGV